MRGFRSMTWSVRAATMCTMTWLCAGCPGDDGAAGNDTEAEDTTAGSTTDRDTDGMTDANTMSGTGGTSTTSPGLDSTGNGMESGGFITAGSDDAPMPQPNGAQCTSGACAPSA